MSNERKVYSVEETWGIARDFAKRLRAGDVVCLEGDLGAGKTTFTQGLAAAIGASGRVASPTFCIVREHPVDAESAAGGGDNIPLLVHMDLYRLNGEDDVEAIGWDDYLSRGAVIVVEWPERAGSLIPANAYRITFRHCADDDEDGETRLIAISGPGA